MRLRRRLTIAMAVLLVIGLAVADIVTYTSLRSFLFGRLDDQLAASQSVSVRYLVRAAALDRRIGRHLTLEQGFDDRVSPDIYVMVVSPAGKLIVTRPSGPTLHQDPRPVVPRSVRLSQGGVPADGPYRPNPNGFTVRSASTRTHAAVTYRAQAAAVPQGVVITAVTLTATEATLSSLVRIELAVSVGVLVALCGLALWTVRRGLRPLEDMTTAAGAIASGDLGRRVGTVDESTEVGRLGAALNAMLARIQVAFEEKSASEARLRQFVADASHELRTPLTSIRGYAELLRKGAFDDEEDRRRALGRVEREAARMGGLVDDLLLLARLDQGRPLERAAVDLVKVVAEAVDDARLAAPDRTVGFVADGPVVVSGDRDRLAQVAHNLLGNALVHTPAASPIDVEVAKESTMGVLRVADHGPGLTAARLEQVFDRFVRASPSRTGEGSGLGLSIVRAIAEALGGRAWAAARPGGGTVFVVTVPLDPGTESTGRGESTVPDRQLAGALVKGDGTVPVKGPRGRGPA